MTKIVWVKKQLTYRREYSREGRERNLKQLLVIDLVRLKGCFAVQLKSGDLVWPGERGVMSESVVWFTQPHFPLLATTYIVSFHCNTSLHHSPQTTAIAQSVV